jgi:hypothetical protein
MSLFSKILFGIVVLVVVYALWPRNPQLHKINPKAAARLETKAWEAMQKGNNLKAAFNYYQLYDFQFRISPVQAWNMAQANTSGISKVIGSKDIAEQESQIPRFIEVYTLLQKETGATINPADVGRAAYGMWVRLADGTDADSLKNTIVHYWGLLFLQPALDLGRPAALRADAMLLAFGGQQVEPDWEKVRALLTSSWQELIASFPQTSTEP